MNTLRYLLLVVLSCSCALSPSMSAGETDTSGQDAELIQQLGADRAEDRDKAEQDIWNRGKKILPLLEQAARGDDPEVTERANGLIAKIKLSLKPDVPSVQSEFADQYLKADEEQKGELMAEFMEREDITPGEARAAIRLQMQSLLENGTPALPNDWQLDKLNSLLTKETGRLLKENKLPEAIELWSDIDFSPWVRHRYASLLHNSGLPFDETRFSPQDAALMKTELALLNGDRETAKKLIPEGDSYTGKQIAAAELDLSALWRQELEDAAAASDDDQSLLPLAWAIARRDGDKNTQQQTIDRLSQKKTSPGDMAMDFGLGNSDSMRAWYLLSCGEQQKAIDLIAQSQPDENSGMDGRFQFVLSFGRHQNFNPVLLGAKSDTLADILSLAESLSPLKNNSIAPKNFSDPKESAKFQKLITLTNYLEARGEGSQILPHLKSFLKNIPNEYLPFAYFSLITMLNQSESRELAFEFYKTASRENTLAEHKGMAERNLSGLEDEPLDALLKLAGEIHPESKSREERMEILLKMTTSLPAGEEERTALQTKTREWVNRHKNEQGTEFVVASLIEKMRHPHYNQGDILALLETYGKPVLPHSPFSRMRFLNLIAAYGSLEWKHLYLNYLTEIQKKAGDHYIAGNQPQLFSDLPERSMLGEYIAVLHESLGHKEEAQKARRQGRILSPSEKKTRQLEAILKTGVLPVTEILKKSLPYSFTEPESPSASPLTIYQNIIYGNMLLFKCFEDALFKEASFLAENLIKENLLAPSMLHYNLRGVAELVRGLHEWQEGKKGKALESLALAKDLMDNESNGLLYISLIHYIPEQRETWKKWYVAQRAQKLEILKTWPRFDRLRGEIIMPALFLDSHFDEAVNMIEEISPLEPGKNMLLLLTKMGQARKRGDLKEARSHLDELKRTYLQTSEPYVTLISKELEKQEAGIAVP